MYVCPYMYGAVANGSTKVHLLSNLYLLWLYCMRWSCDTWLYGHFTLKMRTCRFTLFFNGGTVCSPALWKFIPSILAFWTMNKCSPLLGKNEKRVFPNKKSKCEGASFVRLFVNFAMKRISLRKQFDFCPQNRISLGLPNGIRAGSPSHFSLLI